MAQNYIRKQCKNSNRLLLFATICCYFEKIFDAFEMVAAETGWPPSTQKQNQQLRRDDPEENACGIDSGIGNGWFIVVHSA